MNTYFKSTLGVLGILMSAFSIIGIVQHFLDVGLHGIFADLYTWYHGVAEWIFRYVFAWLVFLIWPDFRLPPWLVDLGVGLYVLTITGSRVIAGRAISTTKASPQMSHPRRWFAYATLWTIFYFISLASTFLLIGPAVALYAIVTGARITFGWAKPSNVYGDNEADQIELAEIYVNTFKAALSTLIAVLFYFVSNAYAPGAV